MSLKNLAGEAVTSGFGFVASIFTGDLWPLWVLLIIGAVVWAATKKEEHAKKLMRDARRERIKWEKKYGVLRRG